MPVNRCAHAARRGKRVFLAGQFADAGVIQREIDRAIHEQAMRANGFRIIPIVLGVWAAEICRAQVLD